MHYVYIVRCADGSLYTGYSTNISERVKKHNGKLKGGAKYTKGRNPVKLVYNEEYEDKGDAMRREIEIKSFSKQDKEKLISGLDEFN